MEQTIKPKSPGGLTRALSGLFISKDNPLGITPKECTVISIIFSVLGEKDIPITKEHKEKIAHISNHSFQVTTNYINKFRKKKIITGNRLHPFFFAKRITIEYGK